MPRFRCHDCGATWSNNQGVAKFVYQSEGERHNPGCPSGEWKRQAHEQDIEEAREQEMIEHDHA